MPEGAIGPVLEGKGLFAFSVMTDWIFLWYDLHFFSKLVVNHSSNVCQSFAGMNSTVVG